jgi:hypothetical protein
MISKCVGGKKKEATKKRESDGGEREGKSRRRNRDGKSKTK